MGVQQQHAHLQYDLVLALSNNGNPLHSPAALICALFLSLPPFGHHVTPIAMAALDWAIDGCDKSVWSQFHRLTELLASK